jgi:hypothetical protein
MPQRKKPQEEQPDAIKAALMQASGHASEGETIVQSGHRLILTREDLRNVYTDSLA